MPGGLDDGCSALCASLSAIAPAYMTPLRTCCGSAAGSSGQSWRSWGWHAQVRHLAREPHRRSLALVPPDEACESQSRGRALLGRCRRDVGARARLGVEGLEEEDDERDLRGEAASAAATVGIQAGTSTATHVDRDTAGRARSLTVSSRSWQGGREQGRGRTDEGRLGSRRRQARPAESEEDRLACIGAASAQGEKLEGVEERARTHHSCSSRQSFLTRSCLTPSSSPTPSPV